MKNLTPDHYKLNDIKISDSSISSQTSSDKKRHRKRLADEEVTRLRMKSELENIKQMIPRKMYGVTREDVSSESIKTPTFSSGSEEQRSRSILYRVKKRHTSSDSSTDGFSEYLALPDIGSRATLDSGAIVERVSTNYVTEMKPSPNNKNVEDIDKLRDNKIELIQRAKDWLEDYQYLKEDQHVEETGSNEDMCIDIIQQYNEPNNNTSDESLAEIVEYHAVPDNIRPRHFEKQKQSNIMQIDSIEPTNHKHKALLSKNTSQLKEQSVNNTRPISVNDTVRNAVKEVILNQTTLHRVQTEGKTRRETEKSASTHDANISAFTPVFDSNIVEHVVSRIMPKYEKSTAENSMHRGKQYSVKKNDEPKLGPQSVKATTRPTTPITEWKEPKRHFVSPDSSLRNKPMNYQPETMTQEKQVNR